MLYVPPPIYRHAPWRGFALWEKGDKNVGRAFPLDCAEKANNYARRTGAGARIYEMPSGVLIAEVKPRSEGKRGLVTEVTWEGGKYL